MQFDRRSILLTRYGAILIGVVLGVTLPGEVSRADRIDRMMAVIDGRVVTLGDVQRHRDLAVLFGDPAEGDESELLQEVITDMLIQDQIDQFPGLQVEQEQIDDYISQITVPESLTPALVRDSVRKRLERINYFDLRFRRFTEATVEDMATYYDTVFRPEALARGLEQLPPLDDVRDLIGENVVTEKVDRQISLWVESLIARSDIEVVE